jgi:hypothetical protein
LVSHFSTLPPSCPVIWRIYPKCVNYPYEQYQQEVTAAKDTALQTLGGAVKVVLDEAGTPADQVRPAIYQTIPRDKLLLAWQAVEALLHPTRHSKLSFLAKRYFKQFTPYLLGQIVFQHGFTGDDFGKALELVIGLQQGSRRKLPPAPPSNFVKPLWRKFAYKESIKKPGVKRLFSYFRESLSLPHEKDKTSNSRTGSDQTLRVYLSP